MAIFELLSWLVLGAVLGILVAAFWPTRGLTWIRGSGVGMFGAVVGGLIGRTLFAPGMFFSEIGVLIPTFIVAGLGAVVVVLIDRFRLQNLERPHLT
jgi:uncharacterized membrane protein YeaQ/YmgE (transglycosylase-associated protein family)